MMKLKFLGTGTSTGIPQIACDCEVCTSTDSKDKRLRASVLIEVNGGSFLIDAGPDLRQQLILANVRKLSGVLITHEHYDHIGGLDDIRPLGETDIFAEKRVLDQIRVNMPYCFAKNLYPGVPRIRLHEIYEDAFEVNAVSIQPIRYLHANLPVLGYRIDKLAYLTDLKYISDKGIEQLKDLDVLVLNALRVQEHIAHINLTEALDLAKRIGAKRTFFTHFSHDLGKHTDVAQLLPPNVFLAYDGLVIEI